MTKLDYQRNHSLNYGWVMLVWIIFFASGVLLINPQSVTSWLGIIAIIVGAFIRGYHIDLNFLGK